MFSEEERRVAIETFIKYDHSYTDTVAELGYPNRATLGPWWREYESTGEISKGIGTRQSKYADEQTSDGEYPLCLTCASESQSMGRPGEGEYLFCTR